MHARQCLEIDLRNPAWGVAKLGKAEVARLADLYAWRCVRCDRLKRVARAEIQRMIGRNSAFDACQTSLFCMLMIVSHVGLPNVALFPTTPH